MMLAGRWIVAASVFVGSTVGFVLAGLMAWPTTRAPTMTNPACLSMPTPSEMCVYTRQHVNSV